MALEPHWLMRGRSDVRSLFVLCRLLVVVALVCTRLALAGETTKKTHQAADAPEAPPPYVIAGGKGEIVIVAENKRTLTVGGAEQPLYDPVWQVVWFQQQEQLVVADLRAASKDCCLAVAANLPAGTSLTIEHANPRALLEYAPTCDHEIGVFLSLGAGSAKLSSTEGAPLPRLTTGGERWLRQQRRRRVQPAPQHWEFLPGQATPIPVPKLTGRCTATQACGLSVPFGPDGRRLVLVADGRGDCWHGQCLLFDPKTQLFATPPAPNSWHAPAEVTPGSCGPYRFSPDQRWFLTATQVCRFKGPCLPTEGRALGWLTPGPVVGAPE
jgi:hypothetical protein